MERVILIKYGELTTKKGNRNFFVHTLTENIKMKLKNYHVTIKKDLSRMSISFDLEQMDEILEKINQVFGIHAYHIAHKVPSNIEDIKIEMLTMLKSISFSTFKIEVKRSDKTFSMNSMELERFLGGVVLKNLEGKKVDVHHPDVLFKVELCKDYTYLYTNSIKGLGGYPVGTQPKALAMLSGGIDSPVAIYLALKRGIKVDAVYFEAMPHTSIEAREKVISLTKKLAKYKNKITLYVVPFTEIQEAIYKNGNSDYCITIMRRMMYRIMDRLCKKNKAVAIINGESIGQVASQTLNSMAVINEVTKTPIIRPVACLDKLEIIDIAKKIDTYEISILPFEDCCTVFVPKHPVINPVLEECLKSEEKFDYFEMIQKAIDNILTFSITEDDKKKYEDLL